MSKLPIDIVQYNAEPKMFKWRQVVQSPNGPKTILYEEYLPAKLEDAIEALIELVKRQEQEIKKLKEQLLQYEED